MGRRRKILTVSDRFLAGLFAPGPRCFEVVSGALPPDARIADVRFDGFAGRLAVLLESDEFDEVPEGEPYPEITPRMTLRTIAPDGLTGAMMAHDQCLAIADMPPDDHEQVIS